MPTVPREGWTIETALDHIHSLISSSDRHFTEMLGALDRRFEERVTGNDRRYEERFNASQTALAVGLAGTKSEINAALVAADRAVTKAELATEKRFESVNEFRGTLDNQQRTLIPRSEVSEIVKGLDQKIEQLTKNQDKLEQDVRNSMSERQGVRGGWGYAVGALGFLVAATSLITMFVRLAGK